MVTARQLEELPWKDEREFYELHSRDLFSRFPFYHSAMVGGNRDEFLNYIVRRAGIFSGAKVVDLGCGSGFVVGCLHKSCDAIGISTSSECIRQCRVNYPAARFEVASMEDFNCRGADICLALESIGYSDLRPTFANVFSGLSRGGVFYVKEPCRLDFENDRERENREHWEYYWKYKVVAVQDFIRLANQAGFRLQGFQDLSGKNDNSMFLESLRFNRVPYSVPHPAVDFVIPCEFLFVKP